MLTSDKTWLVLYVWVFVVLRSAVYPQTVYSWYTGMIDFKLDSLPFALDFALFARIVKIVVNKASFHERSLFRNSVFDFLRCEFMIILRAFYYMWHHGPLALLKDSSLLVNLF